MLSPLSRGLFHRAILQSPAILRKNYTLAEAEKAAVAVVGTDLAALRAMPAAELLPKTFQIGGGPPGALTAPQPIRMITDGWAFLEDERAALLAGHFTKVPMLIGGVEAEGPFFVGRMPVKTHADYQGFLKGGFGRFADEATTLYPASTDAEGLSATAAFFGDSLFNYGVRGMARLNAQSEKHTYRYLFTRRRGNKATPPSHVEEVPYVFGTLDAPFFGGHPPTDAEDKALSATMMGAWVRFAATGNPNGDGLSWPAYDAARDNYIVLGAPLAQGAGWRSKEMDFFERVFAAG
jgi:para-nitrobenzyl esterase